MAINLRGDFDAIVGRAEKIMEKFEHRVMVEDAKPAVWSKDQMKDMLLIRDFMFEMWNAVTEFAAQARDD